MNTMHPGELLCENIIPALNIKITPLAKLLGVSRQHLHAILREEAPISPSLALKLGKLAGAGRPCGSPCSVITTCRSSATR